MPMGVYDTHPNVPADYVREAQTAHPYLAEAHGSRTHQPPRKRRLTGFEVPNLASHDHPQTLAPSW